MILYSNVYSLALVEPLLKIERIGFSKSPKRERVIFLGYLTKNSTRFKPCQKFIFIDNIPRNSIWWLSRYYYTLAKKILIKFWLCYPTNHIFSLTTPLVKMYIITSTTNKFNHSKSVSPLPLKTSKTKQHIKRNNSSPSFVNKTKSGLQRVD